MDIQPNLESPIQEPCPGTSDQGYFNPDRDQSVFAFEGRLSASFRALITWGSALETMTTAAIYRLIEQRADVEISGLEVRPSLAAVHALADINVTGSRLLEDFRLLAANVADFRELARARAVERLREPTFAPLRLVVDLSEIAAAANYVIDRALTVLWALHGPAAHRQSVRPALGWIAVDSESDTPTRPVNIGGSNWPTSDVRITVEHNGARVSTRIRYAISGSTDAITIAGEPLPVLERLPESEITPVVPPNAILFVFIHGHSSRLEEAASLSTIFEAELQRFEGAAPVSIISFDFPTHGYSEYIDHETLSPYDSTTRFVPDRPLERRFGILEYFEKVAVAVVEQIDQNMQRDRGLGILDRIGAVVGGSMGGNLSLRLSERLVTNPGWLRALVAWSAASTPGSFGRFEGGFIPIPSPGEAVEILGKEALDRTTDRLAEVENAASKADFIRIQLMGETYLNDATPELNWWVHATIGLFGPPLIAGLGSLVPPSTILVGHGVTHFVIGGMVALRQSDSWLRADCRASYDLGIADSTARWNLQELYNPARRRMHWRVANEQLLFSHRDEVNASRGRPCAAVSIIPTLLIAGSEDITDSRFDIYNGTRYLAPQMRANAGTAKFLLHTGHSIHSERPKWLVRSIIEFFSTKVEQQGMPRMISAVRRDSRGRITHLCAELAFWSPLPIETVITDILEGRFAYFVMPDNSDAPATPISVVEMDGRPHLRTRPNPAREDNLDELPEWNAHHLDLTFLTGYDNLRGGDDNLDVRVLLKDGTTVQRHNINLSGEWAGDSVHHVQIELPSGIKPDDLIFLELETTSRGSSADNWDMKTLSVRGVGHGFDKEIGYWGFRRFTGDDSRFSISLNPVPARPGFVDRLEFSILTGIDNLRGVRDNLNLEIHFLGGSVQRISNINGGGQWESHTTAFLEIFLDKPFLPEHILRIVLETSFQGGHDGDNWDMNALNIRAVGHTADQEIVDHGYFRFSGNNQKLIIPVNEPPTPRGFVNALRMTFLTGDDDLRGGLRDNINLTINFVGLDIPTQWIPNLNGGVTWNNGSTNEILVAFNVAVLPEQISGLLFETTFRGSVSGDNWNMASLEVQAIGNEIDMPLVSHGFKRFTGNDRSLEIPVVIARPGEASALILEFETGDDNLRGGNDNISLTIQTHDGHIQRVPNINGGAKWDRGSRNSVHIPLDRALRPRDFAVISLTLSFAGGIAGDNWNMHALSVRALGNEVDLEIVTHGFKRFRGDDNSLSIPIAVAEPGQLNMLQFKFYTGGDNLRGDLDNLIATVHYLQEGIEQSYFLRNLNGGQRWHKYSINSVRKTLPVAISPADLVRIDFETHFTGGIDGDNWDMEVFELHAFGNEVDQTIVTAGFKRFTGDDGRLVVRVGPIGLVTSLFCVFQTGHDNLRGGDDNVDVEIIFRDRGSQIFRNINHGKDWPRGSVTHLAIELPTPVELDTIIGLALNTTFGGGVGGDNWDMATLVVMARGNNVDQSLFLHGFNRFTGDNRRLELTR